MALSNSSRKFIKQEAAKSLDFSVFEEVLTTSEALFANRALGKMIPVHRPSWPDFMLLTEQGLVFVEVKGIGDHIRENQRRTFNILTRHGHKVYIWREKSPDKLILWKARGPKSRKSANIIDFDAD